MKRKILVFTLLLSLVITLIPTTISMFGATSAASPYTEIFGTLNGANYAIRIPNPIENWNRNLVVFCHGYSHLEVNESRVFLTSTGFGVDSIIANGYAVAASTYGAGGVCIQQGINSTYQLTQYVIKNYNVTGKVFLYGISMGGGIALLMGQKYPQVYSGVLDLSGNKDAIDAYNTKLDFLSAANDSELAAKLQAINASVPPYPFSVLVPPPLSQQLYYFRVFLNQSADDTAIECGGTPQNASEAYIKNSATGNANISIPVITVHGTSDGLVPFSQALKYQAAVAAAGRSNLYRLYAIPGGQHVDAPIMNEVIPRLLELNAWSNSLDGWTLVTDAREMKAYPDLREYIWQKNASMAPNGQYDKIGLHRLIKSGIIPKGVVFITTGTSCNGAEQIISNPPTENFTLTENYSVPIYWANRGFDVYSIDYRTHFVPVTLNLNETIFMANWGYDQWISDTKEAVDKVKEVSGAKKIFIASFGYNFAMFYASKFWKQDLQGIILLDAQSPSKAIGTNTYNLTDKLSQMDASGNYGLETLGTGTPTTPGMLFLFQYALQNPSGPAVWITGTPLPPLINPLTNKTWANITEYIQVLGDGPNVCNIAGGNGNITAYIRWLATMDRYWPLKFQYEAAAISDWTNCPYVAYDYDDHFKEINVPLISFQRTNITNGIANADFTSIVLPTYGKVDIYSGINTARDVSEPAYRWMINHTFPAIVFSNGFEDGFNSWTATQGGVSEVSSTVHSGNYSMKCSNPWGSQATKSIPAQSKTYAEAQFYFSQDFAGSQSLIAFFDANGKPTVEMGLSSQSGKLFAYVQTNLPSYSYSQYPLLGLLPETWYKFALDASETSATVYLDDQQLADTNIDNIAAIASVGVGMFWGDGSYKGNLYIDSVQIADCAPKPVSASVFASGFEDGFNSWNKTYGGALVVSSPVYFGNYSMKCSGPLGSLATKSIGMQSGTLAEAEFYFDGNIAGSQTLIAYFNAKGDPSVSMGISVQEGKVFAFVQSMLPSYSYSQYELTGFTSGTWSKFALGVSATSAAIYMYNQKLASISQTAIPVTASVGVGMFWSDGNYKGNLYIDSVQISTLPPLALPEGANSIEYYTWGEAIINLPTPLPTNYPSTATQMIIGAKHIEIPNDKIDYCQLLIQLYLGASPTPTKYVFAIFTTSSDDAAFMKTIWSGVPFIEFPGPYYNPAYVTTDNVILVSDDALQVERHGNKMFVNLKVPQQIQRQTGVNFTIPAFSMELNGYGGPFYAPETFVLTGYYGSSNYTWKVVYEGLKTTGVFSSAAWNYTSYPISESYLTIHSTGVYYPPT